MCGEEYNPYAVTDEPKMNGIAAAGEAPPTGGRGAWGWGTRGDHYAEVSEVGADLCGDMGVIIFWYPHSMCVFDISAVETDAAYYDGRHPRKIFPQNKQRKKGKYIEACLERRCHFTPLVLSVYKGMG